MYFTAFRCLIVLMVLCHALCHEPAEDNLICFNDYETEIKCSLSYSLIKCPEYKLNTTQTVLDEFNEYSCIFERSHHNNSVCECNFKVPDEFVPEETFYITLLEGENVLFKKTFHTLEFIKPKTPAILSVEKTPNGNFKVTWDNKYKNKENSFAHSLQIELTYGIKGEKDTMPNKVMNRVGFYEIVGRNLQPNANYILTARASTEYNNHQIFSDQSTPYEFTTSSSLNEMFKMVIPGVCVGLIIIIFIIFICFFRIKRVWWDKIIKPQIDPDLGKQKGHMLSPSNMKFSPIVVEIPKLDVQDDKKCMALLSENTNNEKSFNSVDSTVDYGQACSVIQDQNMSIITRTMLALQAEPLLPFSTVMPGKKLDVSCQRESNRANRDSGNGSGSSFFSNNSYLESSALDNSLFLDLTSDPSYHSYKREVSNPVKTQLNSPAVVTVEDGYQDIGNTNLTNISSDVDKKFIIENLMTSKNPLDPSSTPHDGGITPSDNEYQDFQSLSKNTGGQWSSTTQAETALGECGALKIPYSVLETDHTPTSIQESSWISSLHISPCIQIDSSYHSV
ncbi:interleukin-4 receptor subunit alpha-like [Myxocyprinus asiaticus]|uniref:interleukin-4 receptor subunit alpha-like n=1 Tax=Myxocyprinus asiaticus TaxID=70543 RepID=UPI002223278E|nr:interleukin-4 receptor subunit alpha-like [Myxocyprinus asiaticus]